MLLRPADFAIGARRATSDARLRHWRGWYRAQPGEPDRVHLHGNRSATPMPTAGHVVPQSRRTSVGWRSPRPRWSGRRGLSSQVPTPELNSVIGSGTTDRPVGRWYRRHHFAERRDRPRCGFQRSAARRTRLRRLGCRHHPFARLGALAPGLAARRSPSHLAITM